MIKQSVVTKQSGVIDEARRRLGRALAGLGDEVNRVVPSIKVGRLVVPRSDPARGDGVVGAIAGATDR